MTKLTRGGLRLRGRLPRNIACSTAVLALLEEAEKVQRLLEAAQVDTSANLMRTQTLLLERDSPTQLIVELVDSVAKQVRQRELMAE